MDIVILDAMTLGSDIDFGMFDSLGNVTVYDSTDSYQLEQRISNCDVIIVNKIKLGKNNLSNCKNLKLICVAATGFDNIDLDFCRLNNIAVCNVVGYSTDCVAQVTVSMVLSLVNHLPVYDKSVKSGVYTKDGIQNRLIPVYHELQGKTWGIVGAGNIGKKVAEIAGCFGCDVLYFKKNFDNPACVTLPYLMEKSDIITIHLPLNEHTVNIIDKKMISLMKKEAIIVNTSRGAVWDEYYIADAILKEKIAGMGCDVYSFEPIQPDHPFVSIMSYDNVCLTPHMAWGSYESRVRCMNEIFKNISMFYDGVIHNRVDI